MPEDSKTVVQPGQTSTTEPSPTAKPPESQTTPAPAPLTKESVAQMIADATATAIEQAKELGKRELQGAQDRNKAEIARAERRANIAEAALKGARTHAQSIDPEVAKELELAELRAREQGRTQYEQEELTAESQEKFHVEFLARQQKFITDLGIDPKDKRIDWAGDAKDYLEAMERVQGSVAKIQKENVKTLQDKLDARLKSLEAKVNQANTDANSVNTELPGGAPAGSDAEFMKQFGAGTVPATKENVARVQKIQNSY